MGALPSTLIGLEAGSLEAFCIDQALWYLGTSIEHEMEKASHKPSKQERKAMGARQRVLDKYITPEAERDKKFADPAMLFG